MHQKHTHYLEYLDVRGDGRVVLYKRADHRKPNWTVRLKIPNTRGFVVRSCKTAEFLEARRFADDLYYELEGRMRRGEPIKAPTFERVFRAWAKAPVAERHVRTSKYVNGNVRRLEIWALPYLGNLRIDQVTENALGDYIEWRLTQPKRPALSTLRNERTALNQLLRFAKRKGYIRELPEISIRSSKQTARPDIPETEWFKLTTYLEEYVVAARDRRRRREAHLGHHQGRR